MKKLGSTYELKVRVYESGRRVRCILIDNDSIISLEESFDADGGLTKYSVYGSGIRHFSHNSYQYEDLKIDELSSLECENIDGNSYIHIHQTSFRITKDEFKEMINECWAKNIKAYRKIKLEKLAL